MKNKKPSVTSTDPITGQSLELSFSERNCPMHEGAKELLAHWETCRRAGDFVMGRDIPARKVARLTKHLVVFEPVEGGKDYKLRLVGNVLIDRFGRDVTGMLISEVYDEAAARSLSASLGRVVALDQPVFLDVHVRGALGDVRRPETVLLPMKAPDGKTPWVLCGVFYW